MTAPIEHAALLKLLNYDQLTGIFTRRNGAVAGGIDDRGYVRLRIGNRTKRRAHQLAWFYVTGVWSEEVDHRDGDKLNNKFANLRDVTRSQNQQNLGGAKRTNKLGMIGVNYHKASGLYRAQIQVDKKKVALWI